MEGRYQNAQLLRSGWTPRWSLSCLSLVAAPGVGAADFAAPLRPALVAIPPFAPSFTGFSAVGVFDARSKGFPVDLGVLAPKFEKAPVPRAKALDAPPGEASPLPGVLMSLRGFLVPCDELSPPNRLEMEEFRPMEPVSLRAEPGVVRESLLVLLEARVSGCYVGSGDDWAWAWA